MNQIPTCDLKTCVLRQYDLRGWLGVKGDDPITLTDYFSQDKFLLTSRMGNRKRCWPQLYANSIILSQGIQLRDMTVLPSGVHGDFPISQQWDPVCDVVCRLEVQLSSLSWDDFCPSQRRNGQCFSGPLRSVSLICNLGDSLQRNWHTDCIDLPSTSFVMSIMSVTGGDHIHNIHEWR